MTTFKPTTVDGRAINLATPADRRLWTALTPDEYRLVTLISAATGAPAERIIEQCVAFALANMDAEPSCDPLAAMVEEAVQQQTGGEEDGN